MLLLTLTDQICAKICATTAVKRKYFMTANPCQAGELVPTDREGYHRPRRLTRNTGRTTSVATGHGYLPRSSTVVYGYIPRSSTFLGVLQSYMATFLGVLQSYMATFLGVLQSSMATFLGVLQSSMATFLGVLQSYMATFLGVLQSYMATFLGVLQSYESLSLIQWHLPRAISVER